ncbi:FliM/FliN family flagellar motor C-terminal domain-containing protein [Chitinimonas sp. PSY-7]|uniref:FliM/FliN family flagellar motor switch protein n=1 Tax=Chitinimonas sp. PSY-7 TaxID=3459088 RepID=UPI0040401049
MEVREYCLLGETALAEAKGMIIAALQAWQSQWGGVLPLHTLHVRPVDADLLEQLGNGWRLYSLNGRDIAWVRAPHGLARSCEQVLFAEQRNAPELDQYRDSPLALQVATSAADALLFALAGVTTVDKLVPGPLAAPPASLSQAGSSAVLLEWSLVPGQPLQVIYPRLVPSRRLRRSTMPLVPVKTAVECQRIQLQIDLGEIELSLGQLQSLHVGDVVRLDRHLGDALHVSDTHGHRVCHALPGQRHGSRAVEVHKLK